MPPGGGDPIVTHQRAHFLVDREIDTPITVDTIDAAWAFTQAIATRRYVQTMIAEADGVVRTNNYPRPFPVRTPFPPRTPWTIHLTDEVDHLYRFAVFDIDAKKDDEREVAAENLGTLVRVLRELHLPHVIVRSSPTGGYHVWIPLTGVPVETMRSLGYAAKAVLQQLDFGLLGNAKESGVRPPGAPHMRGGASTVMQGGDPVEALLTPTVSEADIVRLTDAFRAMRPPLEPTGGAIGRDQLVASEHSHRPLHPWGEALMATPGGGHDPSLTGYRCLIAAAYAGWSLLDVEHAARTRPGMEHFRTANSLTGPRVPRKPHKIIERLERQFAKAQEYVRDHPYVPRARKPRDLSELQEIVEIAEGVLDAIRVSPGRWTRLESDLHDSTILLGLAWTSLQSGQRDISASIRTIAMLTGIPSTTVDRSMRRLRAAGWIELVKAADGAASSVYRVSKKFSTASDQDGPLHKTNARPPEQLFDARAVLVKQLEDRLNSGRSDVFTRQGLGPAARRVHEALSPDAADDATIADRAGMSVSRVRVQLRRLRRYSLAIRSGLRWRRRRNDVRASVAMKLGVYGVLARRSRQYGWERELWAWWNAELAFRAGRSRKQRRRPDTGQVRFSYTDVRGDENAWPAYPRDHSDRADHLEAMRWVVRGELQTLRNLELAA